MTDQDRTSEPTASLTSVEIREQLEKLLERDCSVRGTVRRRSSPRHIDSARQEILLVSYATHTEPEIAASMAWASDRHVEITLLMERTEDNPRYRYAGSVFPGMPALRLAWPAAQRPPGASMHAKVIVVDAHVALIGSANLTGYAMDRNLECGVMIRGGSQPGDIVQHIRDLVALDQLRAFSSPDQ